MCRLLKLKLIIMHKLHIARAEGLKLSFDTTPKTIRHPGRLNATFTSGDGLSGTRAFVLQKRFHQLVDNQRAEIKEMIEAHHGQMETLVNCILVEDP